MLQGTHPNLVRVALLGAAVTPGVALADEGLLSDQLASDLMQVATLVGQTGLILVVLAIAATAFRLWEASRVRPEAPAEDELARFERADANAPAPAERHPERLLAWIALALALGSLPMALGS